MPLMIPPKNANNPFYGRYRVDLELGVDVKDSDVDCLMAEGWTFKEDKKPKRKKVEDKKEIESIEDKKEEVDNA